MKYMWELNPKIGRGRDVEGAEWVLFESMGFIGHQGWCFQLSKDTLHHAALLKHEVTEVGHKLSNQSLLSALKLSLILLYSKKHWIKSGRSHPGWMLKARPQKRFWVKFTNSFSNDLKYVSLAVFQLFPQLIAPLSCKLFILRDSYFYTL